MAPLPVPPSPPPFLGLRTAQTLGAALLAGLALLIALGMMARARVGKLEHFEERTGFGDTQFWSAGPVTLDGSPLSPAAAEALEMRDTRMLRMGRDPATGLQIYTPAEPKTAEPAKKDQRTYYLKAGPDHYQQLRPGAPSPVTP